MRKSPQAATNNNQTGLRVPRPLRFTRSCVCHFCFGPESRADSTFLMMRRALMADDELGSFKSFVFRGSGEKIIAFNSCFVRLQIP
ncbi:hypothetical protein MPTK1_4g12500 [Marchantia polymorpha subsp. ruderalis]|uniref:Uncharacterized protein n=2 Tax=Marchantia polymorpha TaxID=3197 RepID=A0AAF6B974_MARPO|nr:hypothetical protein MARPO_0174s0012 [Marchantia polymorpha]BBN08558.1 hypothetical protein Mp_4g12500 [Marchantia polymorpha subsp. ruderalis]|eukprot:PTQ28084.1 hypothetical protein MARPO_0174s0012 [Marchantia polymorpha]